MEGQARAAKRQFERSLSQAWHTEAFAREKKLKPLQQYLDKTDAKPKGKTRGGNALLGEMLELQAKGVQIEIKRVKLKPRPTVGDKTDD